MLMVNESDSRTLQAIYDATDQGSCDTIPWVRAGNLYLSVTETGNLTWPPVVLYLFEKGHKNFRVFSGRHGSPGGGFGLDGIISEKVADHSHFSEDKNVGLFLRTGQKKGSLTRDTPSKSLSGQSINLTIEDFGSGSRDKLKSAAKVYLDKGDTVIFAWCFSVASMYLYNAEKSDLEKTSYKRIFGKTVKAVVSEKYGWVKRFVNQRY